MRWPLPLAATLLVACRGAPPKLFDAAPTVDVAPDAHVSPVAAADATTPQVETAIERELSGVVADIASVAGSCHDSCCLRKLPTWLVGGHSATSTPIDVASRAPELRAVLASAAGAPVKALAVLWLRLADDVSDVDVLAPLVESKESAGVLPTVYVGQRWEKCDSVRFEPGTLGGVALAAIGQIAGARRDWTASDFRVWRAEHPRLLDDYAYYGGKLYGSSYGHKALLAGLEARSPDLFLRVVLSQWDHARTDVDEKHIVELVQARIGAARLLDLLQGKETWPDVEGSGLVLVPVSTWVLTHAEALFDRSYAAALESLWDAHADDRQLDRAALAIAASRVSPEGRARILAAAVSRVPEPRVCAELARVDVLDDAATVAQCFYANFGATWGAEVQTRVPILDALAARGGRARPLLRALVVDRGMTTEEPEVVEALLKAAGAMKAHLAFPMRGQINGPRRGLKGDHWSPSDVAAEAKAAAARRDCIARVVAWLT